jgi:cyclopropane fatty-acyl-phospholipid synthase-like methyltransferase
MKNLIPRVYSHLETGCWKAIKAIQFAQGGYHPISGNNGTWTIDKRDVGQRWELMESKLLESDKNVVDLGCSEGFFSMKMAQKGLFTLGLDISPGRLKTAIAHQVNAETHNVAFMFQQLTPKAIERLPVFDVVILTSVFHHLVQFKGMEETDAIMAAIKSKVGRVMFFDTGQSNELHHAWHSLLPDMGEDPAEWIKNYLLELGFSKVDYIGDTVPSHSYSETSLRRAFFAAYT